MIEEQNLATKMRTVVLASELQAIQTKTPFQTLEIVPTIQERTLARVDNVVQERAEDKDKFVVLERTVTLEENANTIPTTKVAHISNPI